MNVVLSIPGVLFLLGIILGVALLLLAYTLGAYRKEQGLLRAHRCWVDAIEAYQARIVAQPGDRSERLAQYVVLDGVLSDMQARLKADPLLLANAMVETSVGPDESPAGRSARRAHPVTEGCSVGGGGGQPRRVVRGRVREYHAR